jgi:hypothetical protein
MATVVIAPWRCRTGAITNTETAFFDQARLLAPANSLVSSNIRINLRNDQFCQQMLIEAGR